MIAPVGKCTVVLSRTVVEVTDFLTTYAGVIFRVKTFSLQGIYYPLTSYTTFNCATLHYLKTRVNVKVI